MGRILANEEEVAKVLREGTMMDLHIVDFAKMPFIEQIQVILTTLILVTIIIGQLKL